MDVYTFKEFISKTVKTIYCPNEYKLSFVCEDGSEFIMDHQQDCCESVSIEEIIGDLNDLIGSPITIAEERTQDDDKKYGDIGMWTFYEFATNKGSVTIRWYGTSNGYYSISVNFYQSGKQ